MTPFEADGALDLPGLRRNLELVLGHTISAIVAAGGTGEVFSLSPSEHREVVRTAVESSAGRVPVLAGVGFNGALGVELARQAAAVGADGLLAFPPYYPNADPDGLADYYGVLASATPLGMVVYSRDWVCPTPEWVECLAGRLDTLVAWKDGSGDATRYRQIIRRLGDRLVWVGGAGDHKVPDYYAVGVRAYTSSIANVAPELSLRLHEAASTGDAVGLARLMEEYVAPLYALRARRRGYEVTVMKAMMSRIGLAAGPVRPPLPPLWPEDSADLDRILETWEPLL